MSKAPPKKPEKNGSPAWVMTFADLMSLLMCFFVLLLSFSELDLQKYKQVAGSMKFAFGVQREVKAIDMPKGTSVIAREFSPGKPTPTILKVIRQNTIDETKQTLEFTDAVTRKEEGEEREDTEVGKTPENTPMQARNINNVADLIIQEEDTDSETLVDAQKLLDLLEEEITSGSVEIETEGKKILVRIREKGSFPSGAATLKGDFLPVIAKLRGALKDINGKILIAGHTDNIPIHNKRFRSNWELSASRAVTVVHELLHESGLDPKRFLVEGHGEAHPLVPNDSSENRAQNRRVELTIVQGDGVDESRDLSSTEALDQASGQASGQTSGQTLVETLDGQTPPLVTELPESNPGDPFTTGRQDERGETAAMSTEMIAVPEAPAADNRDNEDNRVTPNQSDTSPDEDMANIENNTAAATDTTDATDNTMVAAGGTAPETADSDKTLDQTTNSESEQTTNSADKQETDLESIRKRIEKFSQKMEKHK